MTIRETGLPGLKIIVPKVFEDDRGYFFESYNQKKFQENDIQFTFIQDNESKSNYGVIRGLHFQKNPHAQTKLVRVLQGSIYDVAVDIRKGSPTYGQWYGAELSESNKKQFLIPKGFAHGFSVLSETAIVFYKCDHFYAPETEGGIIYNDPTLNINWKIEKGKEIISQKDIKLPKFQDYKTDFVFE
ncbi:MAG: dTDP-4-dehydrorhamnose 3,5-epimerase [Bacteroidetes bacterium]|jgi:dTDP-4-dehydrorhamnose 3,5-epimerase|nr:dTDP-4-dehydrorhamnose 3,5-epimerase [Bacteroidota bacterium]